MEQNDRAERYIRLSGNEHLHGGYVVSIIGQDSYFKPGSEETKWDAPEALDHQQVLKVMKEEIDQPMVSCQVLLLSIRLWQQR